MRINRYSISIIQILEKKNQHSNSKENILTMADNRKKCHPSSKIYINVSLALTESMLVLGPDPVTLIKSCLGIVSK